MQYKLAGIILIIPTTVLAFGINSTSPYLPDHIEDSVWFIIVILANLIIPSIILVAVAANLRTRAKTDKEKIIAGRLRKAGFILLATSLLAIISNFLLFTVY